MTPQTEVPYPGDPGEAEAWVRDPAPPLPLPPHTQTHYTQSHMLPYPLWPQFSHL